MHVIHTFRLNIGWNKDLQPQSKRDNEPMVYTLLKSISLELVCPKSLCCVQNGPEVDLMHLDSTFILTTSEVVPGF